MRLSTAVRIAIYTVLVFLATAILAVETPATGGYFDLGEAAIYAIAAFTPPIATAIAAGIGSAMADLALGYWYFAPATLVIKFTEGYVVSRLIGVVRGRRDPPLWLRIATPLIAGGMAAVVATLSLGYGGLGLKLSWVPIQIAGIKIANLPSLTLDLPPALWAVIAALIAGLGITIAFVSRARPYVLPMAVGGMIMVTGYFLYEYFVSNPLILGRSPIGALYEVPVNVGQFAAGILIAYAVINFVERARGRGSRPLG